MSLRLIAVIPVVLGCSTAFVPQAHAQDVTLSSPSIDFGAFLLGTSQRVALTVANTSATTSHTVNSIFTTDAPRFKVCLAPLAATDPCVAPASWPTLSASSDPASSFQVIVELTPTALGPNPAPPATAFAVVDTDESVQQVGLTGTAVAIDMILLFDNSGSMQWLPDGSDPGVTNPPAPGSRMRLAKDAAAAFVSLMQTLGGIANIRVGICLFNATAAPPDGCVRDLLPYDLGALTTSIAGNDVQIVWAGTQMGRGLAAAKAKLPAAQYRRRAVVMLSDGAHNQGPVPEGVLTAADGIPLFAVGYGNMRDVDPTRLRNLVTGSGNTEADGFRHFDPSGCPASVPSGQCLTSSKQLDGFIVSILQGLGLLDAAADPQAVIAAGATQTHDIQVVELDRAAQFLVTGVTDIPSGLRYDLVDPEGRVIDPAIARQDQDVDYLQGARYRIYAVRQGYLVRPGKLGTWKMRLRYRPTSFATGAPDTRAGGDSQPATATPVVAVPPPFAYTYSGLMASDLHLDARLDGGAGTTGDPVLIEAWVSAYGQRLTAPALAGIELRPEDPEQGIGTWQAEHGASREWIDSIPEIRSGEPLSTLQRKGLAVTLIGGVAPPGLVPGTDLVLHDDGKNGDAHAGDGIYSARLTHTQKPGTYTFQLLARGKTPRGLVFTREMLVQHLVAVNVVPKGAISPLKFQSLDSPERGITRVRVLVIPKDRFGNFMGPGSAGVVDFKATAGRWAGPIEDDLRGGYSRVLDFSPATESPEVVVAVDGKSFPAEDVKRRLRPALRLEGFAGWFFLSQRVPVNDGPVFGARAALRLWSDLHLEAEAGITPTRDSTRNHGTVLQAVGSLRWDLPGLSVGPLTPFVIAGGGVLRFTGFTQDDQGGLAAVGGGVLSEVGARLRLRVDARDFAAFDVYGRNSHNLQLSVSFAVGL